MDGLFYTCIAHVQVVGRTSPAFNIQILEPCGNFLLQYYPEALDNQSPSSTNEENQALSVGNILPPELVRQHLEGWEQILHMLRGNIDAGFEWDEEEDQIKNNLISFNSQTRAPV